MHPIRTADSTVKNTEATSELEPKAPKTGPIELTLETLEQVGGGLAPRGTWDAASVVEAPRGTW
jgi:hypothetical protein